MNLHHHLAARAAAGNPVRVGLIGAGKFGTMFLAQARFTTGMQVAGIADLDGARARAALAAGTAQATSDAPSSKATEVTYVERWVGLVSNRML